MKVKPLFRAVVGSGDFSYEVLFQNHAANLKVCSGGKSEEFEKVFNVLHSHGELTLSELRKLIPLQHVTQLESNLVTMSDNSFLKITLMSATEINVYRDEITFEWITSMNEDTRFKLKL